VKDKKMKRVILTIVLIFAILLGLVGVGYATVIRPRLPEWTVTQMMEQLSELDLHELGLEEELTASQLELFEVILDIVVENLSYEITNSRIEGRMAYVTLSLEVVDTPKLLLDNSDIIFNNILSNLGLLFFTALEGGIEGVIVQELLNLLTDDQTIFSMTTQEVEIELERSGFFWIPILTDEFLLSMIGLNDLDLGFLEQMIR